MNWLKADAAPASAAYEAARFIVLALTLAALVVAGNTFNLWRTFQ